MEVSGIVKRISDTQQVSQSFRKREIVLTTEEQYPQHLSIEFVQDKCELLDQFQDGQKVTISINLRGREWTSPQGEVKYFNTIQGWRIVAATSTPPPAPPMPSAGGSSQGGAQPFSGGSSNPADGMSSFDEQEDDLPF